MHFQNNTFAEQQRAYIVMQRNRARLWLRLSNGVRELIKHPWKLAPLFTLAVLCLLAWNNRGKVAFASSVPLLNALWMYAIEALLVLLSVISLLALLALLGTPCHAKHIEAALAHARVVDRYGFPPALVSRQRDISGEISIMTFYSRGIPQELWEKRRREIEDVLNVRWVEDAKYGGKLNNNGNYIILTVANGTGIVERGEPLYDDEL